MKFAIEGEVTYEEWARISSAVDEAFDKKARPIWDQARKEVDAISLDADELSSIIAGVQATRDNV